MIIKIKVKDTATLVRIEALDKALQELANPFYTDSFSDVIESITSEKQ